MSEEYLEMLLEQEDEIARLQQIRTGDGTAMINMWGIVNKYGMSALDEDYRIIEAFLLIDRVTTILSKEKGFNRERGL